jgi:hypothetical protein
MSDEPKIIVDEDWKAQVQAEKEALAQEAESPPDTGEQPASEPVQPARTAAPSSEPPPQGPLPAPTMALLFTSLATQAMFALGRIADPEAGQTAPRLEEARHIIDTLQLLEDKTKGNLTAQESAMLTRLLYDLRLEYVAARDSAPRP